MSLLAEIKRRKVFQVAVAYAIAAWLLVQVANTIEEPLRLPSWFDTAVIVLVALGFPLALILSWAFQWTESGLVRDRGDGGDLKTRSDAATARAHPASERLEDHSLSEIIAAGAMPTQRLLSLAVRIADPLATAHENQIVHGDVRPANVLISADGGVELVGFGRAESAAPADASAYLAPERARGGPADFRADQFSLGAVLYEMATGRRAFDGATEADSLAAVIHCDPDPAGRVNPDIPLPLQWAIERCLAKRPTERFASTRDLHAELVSMSATFKAPRSVRSVTTQNLPAQRTPLIGRDRELDEIERFVLDRDTRLVTLTGAGGIGKTRLLIQLGRRLGGEFRGGVFFVPLDGIRDADFVGSEIAKSLGAQQLSDAADDDALRRHLHQFCVSRTLLLIDNFEHVLDAAPLISNLLASTEQLDVVVTSRAALRVYGEHEFHVAPLDVPDRDSGASVLARSPAIRLFVERSGQRIEDVDDTKLEAVAEICKRLDGLPLAIELAAARTKVLPLKALLERISDPLQVLSGGPRDSPARQQTLRATLDWSYNLLSDEHRKLFRRLGVFVGGATLEGIEAVCNVDEDLDANPIEAVESLVDSSLLRPIDMGHSEPRFTMLETMREYATDCLVRAGERDRTQRAHAAYFLLLAEETLHATSEAEREALYDSFDRELGNLRAALDWLAESRDPAWGMRLTNSLGHYWLQRGYAFEGFERVRNFLTMCKEDSDEGELFVWALAWTADLALGSGDRAAAHRYYEESLALAKQLRTLPAVLRVLNAWAVLKQQDGDLESAQKLHEEARQLALEAGGSPALVGGLLSNYADLALARGDYDLAQQLHEETAALFRSTGDEVALAWSLSHQGDIARRRGDLDSAQKFYEEALAKFRNQQERVGVAACLNDLGVVTLDRGDARAAEKLNSEALSIYHELGNRAHIPRVVEALTRCALEAGDLERGLTLAGGAAAMRQTLSLTTMESAQLELEESLNAARQRMRDSDASASWMAGWGMQPDEVVDFALRRSAAAARRPAR